MATNELEILRRIRERAASLRAGMEETEGSGLFTADRDQEDREALSRADRLLADRGMDGGDGQLRASPGGVLPFQAEFLRRLQESGQQVTTPQREFEQVTTRPERIMARFGSGLASELTLGREELLGVEQEGLRQARDILNVEQIERRPDEGFFSFAGRAIANSDIEDWADAMGHVAGALPLAVLTGGTANLLARGGLTHATRVGQQATRAAQTARTLADVEQATRVARRAQGAQRLFSVLAREVPEQAGVGMRLLRGATANVFEGAAYSAVAGPARRLEEGQSRGRAIAQEFGIGAAADFVLGMVLGVPGARLGRFAENLRNSDNSIDREMGDAIQRRLTEGAQPEPVNPERIVRPRGPRPGTLPAGSRGELPELPAARGPAGRLTRPRTEGGPAGLLPPEAGGPRLARGETLPPERARAREDVQMERDLPFLSRLRGEAVPAVPRPPLRGPLAPRPDRLLPPEAGGPRIAGGEVAERAERVPGGLPFMTRPVRPERPALPPGERPAAAEPVQEAEALRAPEEDPTAPETLRAEPVEEAVAEPVDISGLRGNVRRAAEEIQQAETPGEVMTAASNLRAQRVRPEDQEVVRTLIERKMGELGEAGPAARGVGPTRGTVDPQERIRALEQEVTELRTAAETDVVTGLRNRRGDQRATEQALQERAPGEEIVRMQGDMDAFKAVNDILGHDVGDELLGEVGRVLDAQFRPEDQISVARHGGDEFSATMRVAPGADVEAIRDRVEAAVAEAIERLGINQRLRDAGFDESVGFSLVGRRVPEGGTRGDVDRELDRALQRRKRERGAGGLEARRRREAQLRGEEEPPPAGPSEAAPGRAAPGAADELAGTGRKGDPEALATARRILDEDPDISVDDAVARMRQEMPILENLTPRQINARFLLATKRGEIDAAAGRRPPGGRAEAQQARNRRAQEAREADAESIGVDESVLRDDMVDDVTREAQGIERLQRRAQSEDIPTMARRIAQDALNRTVRNVRDRLDAMAERFGPEFAEEVRAKLNLGLIDPLPQRVGNRINEIQNMRPRDAEQALTQLATRGAPIVGANAHQIRQIRQLGRRFLGRRSTARKDLEARLDERLAQIADEASPESLPDIRASQKSLSEMGEELAEARAARKQFSPSGRVTGPEGADTFILKGDGSEIAARYRVVDASELHASHDPITFDPNPQHYPEGTGQYRDYRRNEAAQQSVASGAANPDPRQLLDLSNRAQAGPPIVTPHGLTVNGNQRLMILQRALEMNPEGYQGYRAAVAEQAERFGIDPDELAGVENPVVVREIVDPSVDFKDPDQIGELNIEFDRALGKTKSLTEDAASRAALFERSQLAINHLEETLDPETTLRQYLDTLEGRRFTEILINQDFFSPEELGLIVDARGGLTPTGKDIISESLLVAAVGDVGRVRNAPPLWKTRLEHAVPTILRSQNVEGWDLRPVLQEALRVGEIVEAQDALRGVKGKVQAHRQQRGLELGDAGDVEISQRGFDLAQTIEETPKRELTDLFRRYAKEMEISRRQNEAQDLFGFEPKTSDEAYDELFGASRRMGDSDTEICPP